MKRYQIVATDVACAQLCTCFWAVVVLKIYLLSQPTLADSLLNLNLYIYIFMDRAVSCQFPFKKIEFSFDRA